MSACEPACETKQPAQHSDSVPTCDSHVAEGESAAVLLDQCLMETRSSRSHADSVVYSAFVRLLPAMSRSNETCGSLQTPVGGPHISTYLPKCCIYYVRREEFRIMYRPAATAYSVQYKCRL